MRGRGSVAPGLPVVDGMAQVRSPDMATVTQPLTRPNPSYGARRRTRRSIVARAGAVLADRGPGLWERARDLGSRARTAALTLGGLGLVTAAAWEVDSALGKVVAGVSLVAVEYLTGDEPENGSLS